MNYFRHVQIIIIKKMCRLYSHIILHLMYDVQFFYTCATNTPETRFTSQDALMTLINYL